LTASVAAFAS